MTTTPALTFAPAAMNSTVPAARAERKECHHRRSLIAFLCIALLLSFFSAAHADIVSGLRVNIPFAQGLGNDVTGNGFGATLQDVLPGLDRANTPDAAAIFNGSSSTAEISSTFALENQQTFAAWIKPTALSTIRSIFEKAVVGYGGEVDCWLILQSDGTLQWTVNTNDGGTGNFSIANGIHPVPVNQWTHLSAVIDQSQNQIRLYMNGILEASASMGGRNARNMNRPLRIGKRIGNQANNFFSGTIDEFRIYNRALSPADISELFQSGGFTVADTDLDRLPNSWETQYGLDSTKENFHVGNKSDGDFTAAAGQTLYVNDSAIVMTGVEVAGSKEIIGTAPPDTKVGDVFLLHVSQEGTPVPGSPAGTFELVQITSVNVGRIGINTPLQHTYDPTSGAKIQCVHVPQFGNVQVDGTLAARPWNGSSGGIVAVIAEDVVVSSGGRISATGAGFRGGPSFSIWGPTNAVPGKPGEGYIINAWPLGNSSSANSSGGAGGATTGGGGSQPSGQNPSFGGGGGSGGCSAFSFSYGGGQGFSYFQDGGYGGTGGGFCLIICRSVALTGEVAAMGNAGQLAAYETDFGYARTTSQGGGGAGGSLFCISRITGSGTISASSVGAAVGKIHLERGVSASSPFSTTTGDGYFDNQTYSFLAKYNDTDGDGLDDYAEFLSGTSPIQADTDGDGIPDSWELRFGTNPLVADAGADPDHDGRTNLQEFLAGSSPTSADQDSDGLTDDQELNVYGTNPILADSDVDGMDDGWEITNGLNPLVNDAGEDHDLDGLTNKQEYDERANGYRANAVNSKAGLTGDDGKSDYLRLKGESWVHHGYDKNDRLVSTEGDNGLLQLYTYDGNSQKRRDILKASFDSDGDSLPDVWEFTHDLTFSGPTSTSGDNGPLGDPDHDGFTNFAEWKAGTDPRDFASHPSSEAFAVGGVVTASTGFTPTNWVMATGQLDGYGADQVVIGADGAIGTASNTVSIFSQSGNIWSVSSTNAGNIGINSLAIGEAAAGRGKAIYLGSRSPSGISGIQEFRRTGNAWTKSAASVADSTGTAISQVVGVNSSGVLALLSPTGQAADGIYRMSLASEVWTTPTVASALPGKRSWPTPVSSGQARWLDAGGIEINGGSPPAAMGAIKNPATGSWYFLSPSIMTWADAEQYAAQNGGHLTTVNDAAEQQWIQSNFPSMNLWIGLLRGGTGDGWQWISGSTAAYRNWYLGEPNNAGGNESYGSITTTGGSWNDANQFATYKGLVEIPPSNLPLQTLAEPSASSKLIWRGHSLAIGSVRTSGSSVICVFIGDNNTSGNSDTGDDFVIAEFDLSAATPVQRTLVRISQASPNAAGAYGFTTIRRADSANQSTLFIGEPDGTISLWTAPDLISPLVRKVFSTEFKGKAWHQLEPLKEANGQEGLVGLLVDPATPNQCQVIHWSPDAIEAAVSGTAPILNNLPIARVIANPGSGGAKCSIGIRAWDAEAHSSTLTLQFLKSGQTAWTAARLLTADGNTVTNGIQGITAALATAPGGQNHTLVWNAVADLGSTFTGTVLLRTRATDTETGAWSESMPYIVDVTSDLDDDGDGYTNAQELAFGTNTNSITSRPYLIALVNANGSLQLTWPTAAGHTYRIETSINLTQWTTLQSGLATGNWNIPITGISDPKRFYRIAGSVTTP